MGAPLGLQPPPYEEIPIPKMPEVVPQPAEPQQQRLPAGAGRSGKLGAGMNIATNFLRGYLRGRNKSEDQQRKRIEAEFDNFNDQREASHRRWSAIVGDPDAYGGMGSDKYRQAEEEARTRYQAASSGIADLMEQHVKPEKGKGKGGIKGFFSNMFGVDTNMFTQSMVENIRREADTPTEPTPPGQQQRLAGAMMKEKQEGIDLRSEYSELIGLSNSGDITPEQTGRLYTIEDTLSPVYGRERLTRGVARKIKAGEDITSEERGIAINSGMLQSPERTAPIPINVDGKLNFLFMETTAEGSKAVKVPTDMPFPPQLERQQQTSAFNDRLQAVKRELAIARPDWTPQQIATEALKSVGVGGEAKVGEISGPQVSSFLTKAINAAVAKMSPEDRIKAEAIFTKAGPNQVFRSLLVAPKAGHSWYEFYDSFWMEKRFGMTARELQEFELIARGLVESELRAIVPNISQVDLNRVMGEVPPLGRRLYPDEYKGSPLTTPPEGGEGGLTPSPTEGAPLESSPPTDKLSPGTKEYILTDGDGNEHVKFLTLAQASRMRTEASNRGITLNLKLKPSTVLPSPPVSRFQ